MNALHLASIVLATLAPQETSVFQELTLDEALIQAAAEERMVLAHFSAGWDQRWEPLSTTIFGDAEVVEWIEHNAIAVRIDWEVERPLARKYEVDSSSTTVILDADAGERDRYMHTKKDSAPDVRAFLRDVQAGTTFVMETRARLNEDVDDPELHLPYAIALALSGRPRKSMEHYLWAYDNGRMVDDVVFQRFRRRELLQNVMDFERAIGGALDALTERREEAESQIAAGRAGARAALGEEADVAALDRWITASAADAAALSVATIGFDHVWELFDTYNGLEQELPVKRGMWRFVLLRLVPEGRSQELLDVPVDLQQSIERVFTWRARTLELQLPKTPEKNQWRVLKMTAVALRRDVIPIFEALLTVGRLDEARALADRLLTVDSSVDAYIDLVRAAGRAGSVEVGRELGERGAANLEGQERQRIERNVRKHIDGVQPSDD